MDVNPLRCDAVLRGTPSKMDAHVSKWNEILRGVLGRSAQNLENSMKSSRAFLAKYI